MAAPATTGTVGQTVFLVEDFVRKAIKRCGLEAGEIGLEMVDEAIQLLYLFLSSTANHGVTLWTQRRTLMGTLPNSIAYNLLSGTVDVKNVLYRTVTKPSGGTASSSSGTAGNAFQYADVSLACTQNAANGYIQYDFGSAVVVSNVGISPNGAATLNLVWEYSDDASTWVTALSPGSASYEDLRMAWAEVDPAPSARYWRVRETGGATLDVRAVIFGQAPNDLPMSRMNIDEYTSQPNKTQSGTQCLNFFVQRLQDYPQMLVWPTSQSYYDIIVAWNFRHIMDPGDPTNILEVPQRWFEAIVSGLAFRFAQENPKKVDAALRGELLAWHTVQMREAEDEERDDSPIYIAPNISAYTQ